ncbi:helix-turn-helix transcriptional regulator [Actinokineospora auranticolor]|uniref:HTH cro/C1-type domain-containing protein n=1 Tax=Actinokineospora auranticolor TaxID=155976 RepID=A0A2S6GM14_9PSEU|nr:helix-turn-helix transcriptional regulator [Actinokineospora auranticolor]PPK66213.1 hypothetical protein CLV40_111177 [Actinokineospora auranticolor]
MTGVPPGTRQDPSGTTRPAREAFTRDLGRALRGRRATLGFGLARVAAATGLRPGTLDSYERGAKALAPYRFVPLCRALDLTPHHLLLAAVTGDVVGVLGRHRVLPPLLSVDPRRLPTPVASAPWAGPARAVHLPLAWIQDHADRAGLDAVTVLAHLRPARLPPWTPGPPSSSASREAFTRRLGIRLARARLAHRWTLATTARAVTAASGTPIALSTLHSYESGERAASLHRVVEIARVLGICPAAALIHADRP